MLLLRMVHNIFSRNFQTMQYEQKDLILIECKFIHRFICANKFIMNIYRQDLPEGQLCRYFVYSRADFEVFRPAGATRCTDQGQIWQGGVHRRSDPPCQICP